MKNVFFLPEKNEINNRTQLFAYYALLIYIVSLFSEYIPVITNIAMVLVFGLSLSLAFKKDAKRVFKDSKVHWGIILFFLLQVISILASDNKNEGGRLLSTSVPFVLFAISFCFLDFSQKNWNRLLYFFAVATTIASLIGFGYGAYKAIITHDSGFIYNDNICFILGKQAVYFAFYVSAAIIIFIVQLTRGAEEGKSTSWIYAALVWLFGIVFLLASRTAMFSLLLILCGYLGYTLIQKKKYMEMGLLLFSLVIGSVVLIKLFPKTLNRFKGTTETEYRFDNQNMENHFNADFDKNKWNSSNTRAAIWTCALEVWKQSPLIGTGLGDKTDALKKKYEEKEFRFAITTNKNTHNQYLDILMSMGIIGLAFFLCCYFIYPFYIFLQRRKHVGVMLFLLLALCLITENMFARYQGTMLLALLLPLVSKIETKRDEPLSTPEAAS